jgi:hypothetical protein
MNKWKPKEPELIWNNELLEKWMGYFRINQGEIWGIVEDEYKEMAQGVGRYWLEHWKHGPDYGNYNR